MVNAGGGGGGGGRQALLHNLMRMTLLLEGGEVRIAVSWFIYIYIYIYIYIEGNYIYIMHYPIQSPDI